MKFTKMQAYGNDYVYIDAIHQELKIFRSWHALSATVILQSVLTEWCSSALPIREIFGCGCLIRMVPRVRCAAMRCACANTSTTTG